MTIVHSDEYDSGCYLHVPFKEVGSELSALLNDVLGDTLTPGQKKTLDDLLGKIDTNFLEVERWADKFYKDCICDCREVGA